MKKIFLHTSLLCEHLVGVVVLGALNALLLLHDVFAPLGALLRPPGLLLHHAATAAQRTKKTLTRRYSSLSYYSGRFCARLKLNKYATAINLY